MDVLPRLFPDATVLVVLRHPNDHARSLLHQHRSFLEMHRKSPFVRRYMDDIGHYEFGELHRPIRFPGLERLIAERDLLTIDYWLAYWIAAFEHIRETRANTVLVSYEGMCLGGERTVSRLCERLQIRDENTVEHAAALFRPHRPAKPSNEADPELVERSEDLCRSLLESP